MDTLLYAGSFDPVTRGHMDVIRRTAALCSQLVVAVMHNPEKHGFLSVPMRVELLSDREAVVDGCRGILEYNECCIRLCTGPLTVRFTGEGLTMRNFGSLGAVVEGKIKSVDFG